MYARCKNCSKLISFKTQRGNKLSDLRCKCGGNFERMNETGRVYDKSPNEELAKTIIPFKNWPDQRVYFNTFLSPSGKHYFADHKNGQFLSVFND